ncbi:MAG: alpha/beta fold hydrolase [Beijerinckiaceae bacterium]
MTNLVFLPGLNCTSALFQPQIEALASRHHCQVADNASAYSLDAIASNSLAAAPESFVLIGLSMGGYIALEMVRQQAHRIEALVLLDTRASADTPDDAQRRMKTIELAQNGQFEDLHGILWPRLVHPDRTKDQALEAIVLQMMRDTGPEQFVRQQTAVMHRPNYGGILETINIPTLIGVGLQDAITPPEMARDLAQAIPGSALVEFPQCGHLSTLEKPKEVTRAMDDFLQKVTLTKH